MLKARENQGKLIEDKPFIFLESKSDISRENYMIWAASSLKKRNEEIHVFDIPYTYKFDLLDKFRPKLLTSSYESNGGQNGGTHLCSIFQIDKNNHLLVSYHFDVEEAKKDFLSVVLVSNKSSALLKFIEENRTLQENHEPVRTGFMMNK